MPAARTWRGALAAAWLWCACDWYGASTDRRIGEPLTVGRWSVEVRTSKNNQGLIKKSSGDTWAVNTSLWFHDGQKLRRPLGHGRGLCGDYYKAPPMKTDAARAAADARYEEDPIVRSCSDASSGATVVTAQCPGEQRGATSTWLVLWPSDAGVVYGDNVDAPECEAALALAVERGIPPEYRPR